MSDLEHHHFDSFDDVYAAARERAEEGAIVCLIPMIRDDGAPALFTGYRTGSLLSMPSAAMHDSERVRGAFHAAYVYHTRRFYEPRVRFAPC